MSVDTLPRRPAPKAPAEPVVPRADPYPIVARPRSGVPGAVIGLAAAIFAIILFIVLDGQRRRSAMADAGSVPMTTTAFASPPPLTVPTETAPEYAPTYAPYPGPVIDVTTLPQSSYAPRPRAAPMRAPAPYVPSPAQSDSMPPPEPAQVYQEQAPASRGSTQPALIFDAGAPVGENSPAPVAAAEGSDGAPAEAVAAAQPSNRQSRIRNMAMVMPTGTLIPAVLETPIDTARPGLARALVTKDTRGFDGRRVLIPRGSRLTGKYDANVGPGQNRVMVKWDQLIRPDGTQIKLDSPAADALGGNGIRGTVHSYFLQNFLNGVLQTAISVASNPSTWTNSDSVVIGVPSGGAAPAADTGGQGGPLGQTPQRKITVKQGTVFTIFVARDVDFSRARR